MTDRDELLSEQPAPDRHEHASVEAAAAWLAAQYDRPTRWRWQSPHGMSVPLAVSGGSDGPPAPPIVVTDPEGWTPRELVHRLVARYPAEAAAIGLGSITDTPERAASAGPALAPSAAVDHAPVSHDTTALPIVPTETYVNEPSQTSARESAVLVVVVALLVAALVWGAAGMPLL